MILTDVRGPSSSGFGHTRAPSLRSKCLEQLRHMFGRLQLLQDSFYSPVGADEVGGPLGSHVFFPVHAFSAKSDRLGRFRDSGRSTMEREAHAFYEFLVTFDAIAADAEKQEEIVAMVSKAPRLPANAAWLFNVHPATVSRLLAKAAADSMRVKV